MGKELQRLINFCGAKNNFEGQEGMENIKELIFLIVNQYGHFKISDVILIFTNAKLGKYGEMYRMDGITILKWFKEYDQERLEAGRRIRQERENKRLLESGTGTDVDKKGLKKLAEMFGRIAKRPSKEITKRITLEEYFANNPGKQESWEAETRRLYDNSIMSISCDYERFRDYRAAQLLHEINKTS